MPSLAPYILTFSHPFTQHYDNCYTIVIHHLRESVLYYPTPTLTPELDTFRTIIAR